MKRSTISRVLLVIAAMVAAHPLSAKACAVCMSGADSHNGEALNGAIFLMLGFLGAIFSGIGAVAYSIFRRSRTPLPPHSQFTDNDPIS